MDAAASSNLAEFTVSELSFAIKRTMEDAFGLVRLRGEISGYRGPHSSGHAYLCLKDEKAKIDGVIWKATLSGLKFKPEEGLEVIVTGRITTFPGKSSYQIVIEQLEPAGAGALMALLEERKKRLAAEGLFDDARKRPLPFWPQRIGVVTSPTGAVIRDMLHGFTERCPVHVVVWPVRVQGETSGAEVAAAISGFNAIPSQGAIVRPDVIIVARGGGSLEDLWGFNDEAVVRAVAKSAIPVISAVGHETDWTLIDLVADARAPTPTKAAEWAVPKQSDLFLRVAETIDRGRRCVRRGLERLRAEFRGAERGLPRLSTLLSTPRQRLDTVHARLGRSLIDYSRHARTRLTATTPRLAPHLITNRTGKCRDKLDGLAERSTAMFRRALRLKERQFDGAAGRLSPLFLTGPLARRRQLMEAASSRLLPSFAQMLTARRATYNANTGLLRSLSHRRVLERGFTLVRDNKGGIVARQSGLNAGDAALQIEFADGRISVHYAGAATEGRRDTPRPRAAAIKNRVPTKSDGGQGSLL